MTAPGDRRYLESHEWHKADSDTVTIGITQFAADELTDITFVQLPKVGTKIVANQPFGEIESVKATGDLISGISGEVIAVNEQLNAKPGLVNDDPYEKGWMIKVKPSDVKELEELLSSEQYMKARG